jgi:hypothetical protein
MILEGRRIRLRSHWSASRLPGIILLLLMVASCADDSIEADPSVAFMVAEWRAVRMIVINLANPTIAPDLIRNGATFYLDVQPSGWYTAILTAFGQPSTEFGRIEVAGQQILFHRQQPAPVRTDAADFRLSGDTLFLTGATDFDFNLDGQTEPAQLRTDLVKR